MNLIQMFKQKWKGTMEFKNQYGWKKTFIVVKRVILHQPTIDLIMPLPPAQEEVAACPDIQQNNVVDVKQLLNVRYRDIQPVQTIHIVADHKRCNLIIDRLDLISLWNGDEMAIVIATEFARQSDIPLRIITRKSVAQPNIYRKILERNNLQPFIEIEFYSDCDRDNNGEIAYKLDVSSEDIFIANTWWCAQTVENISLRKRFFYIVKDVDEFRHPRDEMQIMCCHALCNNNIDYIFLSEMLRKYYKEAGYQINNSVPVIYPLKSKHIQISSDTKKGEKYKLLFMADPQEAQSVYYFTIRMIEEAIQTGILDMDNWEIYCLGDEVPLIVFDGKYMINIVDKKDYEKMDKLLNEVDLLIALRNSLNVTSLVSEILIRGGVVLTNTSGEERNIIESKRLITTGMEEGDVQGALYDAVDMVVKQGGTTEKIMLNEMNDDWHEAMRRVVTYMQENI